MAMHFLYKKQHLQIYIGLELLTEKCCMCCVENVQKKTSRKIKIVETDVKKMGPQKNCDIFAQFY